MSFTCPRCGMTSWHPFDEAEGYCGNCHEWTGASGHNAYRDGFVHVCRVMCSTCIFQPGNLMQLRSGRVRQMVDEAKANESAIICHKTLDGDNAVCRGFYDRYPTTPLQLAVLLDRLREVDPA